MRASVSVVVVVLTWVTACTAYQPYQYPGLYHHAATTQRDNDDAALNYQKQILQWQQAVAQRAGQPAFTGPWQGRQDTLPPQPTIVAPLPQGPSQPETPPTVPPPAGLPEVDNQLVDTTTTPPSDPLHALCKAPRGQFPGTSCGKFVNCWDDVVIEQECPLGLYFNGESGFCDYAFNVACTEQPGQQPGGVQGPVGVGGGTGGQPPVSGDLGAPGAKCPTEFGTYRSNKNCGVFYMCVGYLPFEFTCPAGLNFHKDLQVCDYPYRVECDGVPSNPPPPEPTGQPEEQTTYAPAPPAEPTFQPEAPAPAPTPVQTSPPLLGPEPTPGVAPVPAPTAPDAYYGLKKLPSDLVPSNTPCRAGTVYRLNPSCSSVAVCRNGYTQVLNCGPGTSFDIYSDRCVSFLRARC